MTTPPPGERSTKLVEWMAAIAAPLTAATAVLYFFGWTRTNALFGYFGVDPAILKFGVSDYLARAVGSAFAPTIGVVIAWALLSLLGRVAPGLELASLQHPVRINNVSIARRIPSTILISIGVAATWCGLRAALSLPDYLWLAKALHLAEPIPAAAALAVGVMLILMGSRLLAMTAEVSTPQLPQVSAVVRVLSVSAVLAAIFWATSVYSNQTGEVLAAYIDSNPSAQSEVVVYSEKSIGIWSATSPHGPPSPDAENERFRYRYTGLRLLIYANDRWLLLTGERGARGRLAVAILRDDDTIRVRLSA